MFQPNNPAIDLKILNERARDELARARPASPKRAGEAQNISVSRGSVVAPSKISHFARNWLRHIPLFGNFLSWASWIMRVRQIARMAFKVDARQSEMEQEIEHLNETLHLSDDNYETNLKTFIVSSRDNARAIEALRAEIEVLHAQNASFREEIKSRSRSGDAN